MAGSQHHEKVTLSLLSRTKLTPRPWNGELPGVSIASTILVASSLQHSRKILRQDIRTETTPVFLDGELPGATFERSRINSPHHFVIASAIQTTSDGDDTTLGIMSGGGLV